MAFKKLKQPSKVAAYIPTASMADIAFLLIIFFMVTTVFTVDKTSVLLPVSQERAEVPRGAAYVVLSQAPGSEYIEYRFSDGKESSQPVGGPQDLFIYASQLISANPEWVFVIKADKGIKYERVDEVVDYLRRAKASNIIFLTTQFTTEDA